jgi:tRNA(fMet)-specific endonuclease VapC
LTVVDFTSDDARNYAEIRTTLERVGRPTGLLDTLIAAVTRRLTLVSNNEREFRRIPGLKLANWTS